jgi:hypothetical protein
VVSKKQRQETPNQHQNRCTDENKVGKTAVFSGFFSVCTISSETVEDGSPAGRFAEGAERL